MRGSGRSILLPLLHRLSQILVRRCLDPLRNLFGPRATDPEIHVIATATSAMTSAAGTDGAADDYAKSVVVADLEEAGTEDLFRKIRADLDMHAVQLSDHQIRAKMEEALVEARASVQAGT